MVPFARARGLRAAREAPSRPAGCRVVVREGPLGSAPIMRLAADGVGMSDIGVAIVGAAVVAVAPAARCSEAVAVAAPGPISVAVPTEEAVTTSQL